MPESIEVRVATCTTKHREKKFTLLEMFSNMTFFNDSELEIDQIEVDGCVIKDGGVRCDYLLNVAEIDTSIFLELKGKRVPHALEQLPASHDELAPVRKSKVYWIVCCTSSPLATPANQAAKLWAMTNYGATLKIKTTPGQHRIQQEDESNTDN